MTPLRLALPFALLLPCAAQNPLAGKPTICGTAVRQHDGMIVAIDYTPDGARVLSASMGGDVRVWDAKTGVLQKAWTVDGLIDRAVFCGLARERIAVSGPQSGVRLFDARTGKQVAELKGLQGLAASPDGKTLATTTAEGQLVLVDPQKGTKSAPLAVGQTLAGPQFSPDGKWILVEELLAGKAYLIERATPKVVGEIQHGSMRGGFAFLPDSKHLLGAVRGKARKLALPGGDVVEEWDVPAGITMLVAHGSGPQVLVAGLDGGAALFDMATGNVEHEFLEHRGLINRLVVAPGGEVLASGGWDGVVRFWSLTSGEQLQTGPDHDNMVTAVALAPDGKTLVSGSWDNSAILWAANGEATARVRVHDYLVTGVAVGADGTWWSTSQDGTARSFGRDGAEQAAFAFGDEGAFARAMALTADGRSAVFAMQDGTLRSYELAGRTESARWTGHAAPAIAMALDGERPVASLDEQGTLIAWDPTGGEARHRCVVDEDGGLALCHVGGGIVVASGGGGALVRFDAGAGTESHRTRLQIGGEDAVASALVALPGHDLVVAGCGRRLCLLSASDLQVRGDVAAPAMVVCLSVSADGTTLAAGLEDGTVARWKVAAPARGKK